MNKYQPHVFVVPEDDRNRQIANGFELHDSIDERRIQVMPPAGGWKKVLDTFTDEYIPHLRQNGCAHVVLLIDFDNQHNARHKQFSSSIPEDLRGRVFVIGAQKTPEDLKQSLNKRYEDIGQALADDCDRDASDVWGHGQLHHNESERVQLRETVWPVLRP